LGIFDDFDPDAIAHLLSQCRDLESLQLFFATPVILRMIPQWCPNLKHLKIEPNPSCGTYSFWKCHSCLQMAKRYIQRHSSKFYNAYDLTHLSRCLRLECVYFGEQYRVVKESLFSSMAPVLAKLQKIELSNSSITDKTLTKMLEFCPNLMQLDICNTSISDHGAKQIGIHGGKIERLYFV